MKLKNAKQICTLLYNFTGLKPILITIISLIKDLSNCRAAGIRSVVFLILSVAVAMQMFIGCKPDKLSAAKKKVRIGISKSFLSIPVYIAKEQGYFSKEGIDVTIAEYTSGKLATKGLFAGEVDVSTVADMPVVINSIKKQDFSIFATFTHSYPFVSIIARKDRGIRTGGDLKGKKIGVNKGTSSHFFLGFFLLHNHLLTSDVELVNIKTVELKEALKNGKVDAVSIWQPYSQEALLELGDNAVKLTAPEIYRTTFNFAAIKGYVKDNPEVLKKILRAIDKACEFIKSNKEESEKIIAEKFNLDKKTIQAAWDDFVFQLSLDQSLLVAWEEIARWAMENKIIDCKKFPNYLDYIYLDALEAIKPEAITIIR